MLALLLLFILGTNAASPDSSTSPSRPLAPVTTIANALLAPGIHPVKYTVDSLISAGLIGMCREHTKFIASFVRS